MVESMSEYLAVLFVPVRDDARVRGSLSPERESSGAPAADSDDARDFDNKTAARPVRSTVAVTINNVFCFITVP